MELHEHTAVQQRALLRQGEITPRELLEHYLRRIEKLDPELGAFAVLDAERALARAEAVQELPRDLPLWGLPLADKDLVARAGRVSAFGSRAFAGFMPEVSDEIAMVLDGAGSVSVGATMAPEFGFPSYTEPLAGRPARNPYNLTLGAGGSSGGAATAVAAGLLPFAPGSDGGGSIRIPAAATGLVGLKPSRGRIPAASGFDGLAGLGVGGPLARTVADAALLLDGMRGFSRTASWASVPPGGGASSFLFAARPDARRFRLAITWDSPWSSVYPIEVEPAARDAVEYALGELAALGHETEELYVPEEPNYAPAFRAVWMGGAATLPLNDAQLDLVEPLTRWLVRQGRALDAGTLARALSWLAGFERQTITRFSPFDAVLTPALAMTPRPVAWYNSEDPEENFAQQVRYTPFTSFVNVAGLPAITLPVYMTEDGLPMGVQLVGRPGGERTLFALGAQLEQRIGWQHRHPPMW